MATYGLRQFKPGSNLHFKLSLKILKQLLTMITHTVNSVLSILRLSQFLCHSRTGVHSFQDLQSSVHALHTAITQGNNTGAAAEELHVNTEEVWHEV